MGVKRGIRNNRAGSRVPDVRHDLGCVMEELKPCPFCGCEHVEVANYGIQGYRNWWVCCPHCDAQGPAEDTEAEAIRMWQTRSST